MLSSNIDEAKSVAPGGSLQENVDCVLDYLLKSEDEIEPKPEASEDKVKKETESEAEVDWDDVEDEWFEFGTDFLIF